MSILSRKKGYRNCIVPLCKNTTIKTPNTLFFAVPRKKELRALWCEVMMRETLLSATSYVSCCEDHFTLEEDVDNYWQYKLTGANPRLKPGVLPHKFECQERITAAKTKWKHLRDNYRTETNKTIRPPLDAEGIPLTKYSPTWIWYDSLDFLKEIVSSRSSHVLVEDTPASTSPVVDSLESTDTNLDCTEYYNDSNDYTEDIKPGIAYLPPLYHKGQKRKFQEVLDGSSVEEETPRLEYDDTYHFLMSTRNVINSLPLNRQMYLRVKIQELIYNEVVKMNNIPSQ